MLVPVRKSVLCYFLLQIIVCAISCAFSNYAAKRMLSWYSHIGLQTLQSSTLSSGRHPRPSDSSQWMTKKQTNDGSTQSASPATWRLFAIHFAQENWGPGHLDCSFVFKQKFWAQRDFWGRNVSSKSFATCIAISTSFELSPLPLSFSTTFWQVPC